MHLFKPPPSEGKTNGFNFTIPLVACVRRRNRAGSSWHTIANQTCEENTAQCFILVFNTQIIAWANKKTKHALGFWQARKRVGDSHGGTGSRRGGRRRAPRGEFESSPMHMDFFFFSFFILRRMGKNKALAHHTSTYFHTRRVSILSMETNITIRTLLRTNDLEISVTSRLKWRKGFCNGRPEKV